MNSPTEEFQPAGERRRASVGEALLPLAASALLLTIGYGFFGINVEILLVLSAVIAGIMGWRLGYSYAEMQKGINRTLYKSMTALLIVTVVGALIGSWIACGTIPMLIYYGLKIISPEWLVVTACVVCAVVSVITGTSWGTIGTIGVALMGIAVGLGINPALTAGAIVAGSYFGDKLSLFSDTTNLAPAAARTNIYDHVGHMLWTTSPAFLIGIVVYLIAGHTESSNATAPAMEALAESLTEQFNITGAYAVLLLIPPVITLGAALLKKPVIPTMLLSCAVAWLLAVTLQTGAPIPHPYITDDRTTAAEAVTFAGALGDAQWAVARDRAQLQMWDWAHPLWAMVRGYELRTENSDLNSLLSRGGMLSMMDTLLIALTAFAFAGIMSITRMLETLLDALLKLATTTGKLVMSTSLSCVLVALCTGSSYLSILLPGELFQKAYSDRGLAAKNLSRTTEDCGTVIVPLIPWSVSGAYISGILGVSVVSYAPWAFMCYLGFVFAVLYGFTGFKIAPKIKEDETAPGS